MKLTSSAVILSLILALRVEAQFIQGHLAILQVGDGVSALGGSGAPVFIKDFSPADISVEFQVALPTNGPNAFVLGNNAFTGSLALSADRHSLVVAGYNIPLPYTNSASIDTSTNTTVPRAVASVDYAGNYSLNVITTSAFNRGTIRGGIGDGKGNFWAGGAADGVQYLGTNSPATVVGGAGAGAIRDIQMVNGGIYYSSSQFPIANYSGIVTFTNKTPTSGSSPAQVLVINTTSNAIPGSVGPANPKGFAINKTLTVAYIVDMRTTANGGGIYRFDGNGVFGSTNWVYAYTIPSSVGLIQDIAVDFSGANPIIYAIAGTAQPNSLVSVIDMGASSTFNTLASSPALTSFRGLALAPVPPIVMSMSRSDGNVIISWNGRGTLQSADLITGPWFDVDDAFGSQYSTPASGSSRFFRVLQ